MKTKIHIIISALCILNFLLLIPRLHATNYSWVGNTSTNWATGANWSPSGAPSTSDTVTITSTGTYQPVLDQNRTVTKLTMTSGTLDLNTFILTISSNSTFTSGTITNGKIYPTGVQAIYSGTTFSSSCEVNSVAGKIFLSGSTFNYHCYFEDTIANASHNGGGGCTFNAPVVIKKNSGSNFSIAGSSGNTFNDSATFLSVRGTNNFSVTDQGTTYFNGHIILGSNTGGDIVFLGASTLASGKTISIDGTVGYSSGDLRLNNFTQSGSTSQSFTLTGAATVNFYNNTWNGAVTFTAPHVLIKMNTFNSTAALTQTSTTTGSNSDGGNTFNGVATISCSGGSQFRLGMTYDDTFNSDLTVSGNVNVGAFNTTIIKGNLSAAGSNTHFNSSGVTGTVKFSGSNSQHISPGGTGIIGFNKIKIDKTGGSVTLDSTITIDDTLTLVSKNFITTSAHLLSMLAGSTVTGASNSSFVSGPVKKTGNTTFIFPTGKGSYYRAIEMSAPSVSTNAYTAEYFDAGQSLGNSMDGTIKYIRDCGYWNLARNSGTSNVTVSLNWDTTPCELLDSATVKVANWNGSTWKDLGNGGITGNRFTGKVANSTTVITWGYFALAYNKCFLTAAAGSDQAFCAGDSVTMGASPVATMGMTPYTYSWSPSGGLSSTSIANPKANPSSTTNYVVSVTDLSGCTITDTARVTHHPMTFTWTGTTSTAWETASNWSPAGVPLYCDNVVIVSGSNNVQLNGDVFLTNFIINSGTLNINSFTLNISGKAAFNGGTINSGWVYISNTDTASFSGTHFGADVDASADVILLNGSEFDETAGFSQNGNSNTTSSGGNVFNFATLIENSGDGNMYLANSSADEFNDEVAFSMRGDGTIYPGYTKNVSFAGNLAIEYNPVPANGTVVFGNNGGKTIFNGDTTQTISYSFSGFGIATDASNADTNAIFKKMQVNKSGGKIVLSLPVRITDSLILTKGYIVTDTTNLLCMRAGSAVTGASDTSFVDGPVKKFGNTAFVFPLGDEIHYRPLEISAPSTSTDAFLAQYFDEGQFLGDSLDTILTAITYCNYWQFERKNGSSNVNVTVTWDTSYCAQFDTTNMRLAYWSNTKWVDKGHGSFSGTLNSGKMTISPVSSYGYFTLGTNQNMISPCGGATYQITDGMTSSYFITTFLAGIPVLNCSPGQTVYIHGTFTIDANLIMANCHTTWMNEDAKIIINTGKILTLTNSHLFACPLADMWDHIKIDGSGATLVVSRSVIEDAEKAVWSHNGGDYRIANSNFNKNWISIFLDSYTTHPGTIVSSRISCVSPYTSIIPTTVLAPHATFRSAYGIQVNDISGGITFGIAGSATADNNFYNLDRGIYGNGSTFNVYNCNFENIDNNGTAIAANATSGSNSVIVGNSAINTCNFTRCTYGVKVTGMDADINNNNFDLVNYGINVRLCPSKSITVNANEMQYFIIGLGVYNSPNAALDLQTNHFNAPNGNPVQTYLPAYGTSAIEVSNPTTATGNITIDGNIMSNTRKGIRLSQLSGTSLAANDFRVIGNIMYYLISYNDLDVSLPAPKIHYGIKMNNCYYAYVSQNIFQRQNTSNDQWNGNEWSRVFGIQGSKVFNSSLIQNGFSYTSSGINLRVDCNGTDISCDDFIECYRGVDLGSNIESPPSCFGGPPVTISTQYPDRHDYWSANITHPAYTGRVGGRASPIANWWFAGNGNGNNPAWPDNTTICNNSLGLHPINISTLCPPPPSENYDRENLIGAIVQDTLEYYDYQLERRYMQIAYAYRELDEDTNRLHIDASDSIYIAFYNLHKHTNIGKFRTVEKLIDVQEYEDAGDSLALIIDTNTIEANRITVLDIYLNTILPGDELNSEQEDALEEIANDCAVHGGPAVYEAWAILEVDYPDTCSVSESRMASQVQTMADKNQETEFIIIPNPAKDFINVFYHAGEADAIMNVTDVAGRLTKEVRLPANGRTVRVDTSDLSEGVYIYSIKINGNKIKTGKFVIG